MTAPWLSAQLALPTVTCWVPSAFTLFEPISFRCPFSLLSTITVCEAPPPWMMTTSPGRAWAASTGRQPRARSVLSS